MTFEIQPEVAVAEVGAFEPPYGEGLNEVPGMEVWEEFLKALQVELSQANLIPQTGIHNMRAEASQEDGLQPATLTEIPVHCFGIDTLKTHKLGSFWQSFFAGGFLNELVEAVDFYVFDGNGYYDDLVSQARSDMLEGCSSPTSIMNRFVAGLVGRYLGEDYTRLNVTDVSLIDISDLTEPAANPTLAILIEYVIGPKLHDPRVIIPLTTGTLTSKMKELILINNAITKAITKTITGMLDYRDGDPRARVSKVDIANLVEMLQRELLDKKSRLMGIIHSRFITPRILTDILPTLQGFLVNP